MQASREQQTGTAGVSAVCSHFELIGWGPVRNQEHDLGTDLFVQVRDTRRFDRGLIVGAQVKAGKSYFKKPHLDGKKEVLGWWYYEAGTKHFDAWVTHCLPHLLILHDSDKNVSYWVHVTTDTVTSTRQGCKILVPAHQTIDQQHADDLLAVASEQRAAPALEGTAFSAAAEHIAPARRLRHALVAPRLIAPHPNVGYDRVIDSVEGVALLTEGRIQDLEQFANKHPDVPNPENASANSDWTWRFVAAIWNWAQTDSVHQLREVFASAPTTDAKAASGVFLACTLGRTEQHASALTALDDLLGEDCLPPIDHGWVLVQRSRIKAETGDISGARDDAVAAQRFFVGDADDVTVSALESAAAWVLFETGFFKESDLAKLLTASDTAVSWWRSETISSALSATELSRYRSWVEDSSVSFSTEEPGIGGFFAAELSADIAGEQSRWRAASALRARNRLMSASTSCEEVSGIVEGLDALRRSGDYRSLTLAMARFRSVGPLRALSTAVNKIPLRNWTHTTALSNFEALAVSGDLMDEQLASQLLMRSIQLLNGDSGDLLAGARHTFHIPIYTLKAVIGLLSAATTTMHADVARLIASQTPPPNPLVNDLARSVGLLDFDQVRAPDRQALWEFGQRDSGQCGTAVLGWLAANGNCNAQAEVVARATQGDLYALSALGDLRTLDETTAAALIEQLRSMATEALSEAHRRFYTFGDNRGETLARLNLLFPSQASWDEVIELLRHPCVTVHHKRRICSRITHLSSQVPEDVRTSLVDNIDSISRAEQGFGFTDVGGAPVTLAIAIGAIDGDDADAAAMRLACGSQLERKDAAASLGLGQCPNMQPILAALVGDRHVQVRTQAAWAVGRLVNTSQKEWIHLLAQRVVTSDGTRLPLALLAGLSDESSLAALGIDIAGHLVTHPSGRVRREADRLLQGT